MKMLALLVQTRRRRASDLESRQRELVAIITGQAATQRPSIERRQR